ncbi:hypothetical protein F511_07466 [Dorcoceras hygrometricum]|uniref:UDP-glycosyltransferase 83A1-like n=1 Tax=Dorcoceras hygrometricum TaxID=472368 RepID=A0A2Z7C8C3_9LAMI|nr:hypothetical protein F511_07466 [Dorcoceras hygrometricum]
MGKPHVIAIPYPAQGHVIPLMEVAQCLAENGVQITFINTEFNHERVVKALPEAGDIHELIHLVAIPDGLEPLDDRGNIGKLGEAMSKTMPANLESRQNWDSKKALFLPASVSMMALTSSAQKLVDDGIIDNNGRPFVKQVIRLSPGMPEHSTMSLPWAMVLDLATQKIIFQAILDNNESTKLAERLICNTFNELEPAALSFIPRCVPIGPLLASNRFGKQAGYFWAGDPSCLQWLDQQPPRSVIYVAFGSFTVIDQTQFKELALGLELSNRPFLWVVRQDMTRDIYTAYPDGFEERPLWMEFDQFLNESYICDLWKVGLGFNKDENEIIKQEEIKNKVEQLLTDEGYKARALELQAKAIASVTEGGCSQENFNKFVAWIKEN